MTWGCMGLGIVDEAAMYEFVRYCTVYTLPISRSLLSGLGSSARSLREQGLMVRYPRTLGFEKWDWIWRHRRLSRCFTRQ